jgi:hypothetical protein
VARAEPINGDDLVWSPERRPWGRADLLALVVWTGAIVAYFWPVVSFQGALFYFDITEINYPYRDFLAKELKAGRFSRWCPGLYCGLPLYSESQAGYLHPLKYLLYPWLATWKAFNLDTVLSVWLTGLGTYGWLRRHVGPRGALTGAGVFGLSGFTWAHLIHTSMINALISVPLALWALEAAWAGGRWRALALGAFALACQVFAGHLQDMILTGMVLGLYGLYRAAIETAWKQRLFALGTAAGMIGLGILLSAVQWIPSKELLDRSPRAGGLSWDKMTYGSWHPELLPTLIVREAYGTRARDTDWMDGFYPYHEMNAYLGVIGLGLAIVGGRAYRDRWVGFWIVLASLGGLLMLGRFTFLFDLMNRVPIVGSSRIPVRYHLWVALAVSALASVGVDRLARPGLVRLRGVLIVMAALAVVSLGMMFYIYIPVWFGPERWTKPYHLDRYRWLGSELIWASFRTLALSFAAWQVAVTACRTLDPSRRRKTAALLPLLVLADLLGAHWHDVPTVPPSYWTDPPRSARRLQADPGVQRVFGIAEKSAGEPGYASEPVDFLAVRETLDWSLPPVWGLATSRGETPIFARRLLRFTDTARVESGQFDVAGVTHIVSASPRRVAGMAKPERVGHVFISRNPTAQPRARLMGRPVYARNEDDATRALARLGRAIRDRVLVEDPDQPLARDTSVEGSARIVSERPERVEVVTDASTDAYLVLADTFDPGWSATLDDRPVPIRPAFVAFRAVFVPKGHHELIFTYTPAGFHTGLVLSSLGLALALLLLLAPARRAPLGPEHGDAAWPRNWPRWWLAVLVLVLLGSTVRLGPGGPIGVQTRWRGSVHPFTWGAGIKAMRPQPPRAKG